MTEVRYPSGEQHSNSRNYLIACERSTGKLFFVKMFMEEFTLVETINEVTPSSASELEKDKQYLESKNEDYTYAIGKFDLRRKW